jgi:hypothetical protein
MEGGDESTCIVRGTCFTSMTAGVPGAQDGTVLFKNLFPTAIQLCSMLLLESI